MQAIHFGAGNIGRGFIGYLLSKSGYEVTFVDISKHLVDQINQHGKYQVITLSTTPKKEEIAHVKAIDLHAMEQLKEAVVKTDLITLSIGANNLKTTGKLLQELLKARQEQNPEKPLDIIACENALFATDILKESILENADAAFQTYLERWVGFPNSAVDRIVPNVEIKKDSPIDVAVEDFFEWDLESGKIKHNPDIQGADYVENLAPYLERKLFLLNGAHAAIAYIGYLTGYRYIHEAIQDDFIRSTVIQFHQEASEALCQKHHMDKAALEAYSQKLLRRFGNTYLQDELSRVGRDPMRKLSIKDRMVSPLQLCSDLHLPYDAIARAVAAGFAFDYEGDSKAMEVQSDIIDGGIKYAISNVTGLDTGSEMVERIVTEYKQLLHLKRSCLVAVRSLAAG
ncbi:MAG: mannitol-1-phosphate 5-dehydrogenase [Ethanoligenens sp.]